MIKLFTLDIDILNDIIWGQSLKIKVDVNKDCKYVRNDRFYGFAYWLFTTLIPCIDAHI